MLKRLRKDLWQAGSSDPNTNGYLIVGLGNPGHRYRSTRHNLGFMVADRLTDRLPPGPRRNRFQAEFIESQFDAKKVVLAKPQTYMNESGIAVGQLIRWYRIPLANVLIVYDELDMPFGTIRLRSGGSAGGHNGVRSLIEHLATQEFSRLRVGIGRPSAGTTVPYVLSGFHENERCKLPTLLELASDAAFSWLQNGITSAMNDFNRRPADLPNTGDTPRDSS